MNNSNVLLVKQKSINDIEYILVRLSTIPFAKSESKLLSANEKIEILDDNTANDFQNYYTKNSRKLDLSAKGLVLQLEDKSKCEQILGFAMSVVNGHHTYEISEIDGLFKQFVQTT